MPADERRPERVAAPGERAAAKPADDDRPRSAALDKDAVCWCCGGRTLKRHCKIVCTNCGFMRDCSDP